MNKKLIVTSVLLGTLTLGTITYGEVKNLIIQDNLIQVDHEVNDLYPLRRICESLGIQISNVTADHIVLKQNNNVITLNRHNQYLKNTKGYFVAESVPIQKNGQTYVDLEVLEKMFGYTSIQTDKGLVISQIPNFRLPEPTQAGQKLYNDLNYIELLEEKFNISYYRASIEIGIKEYNMEIIQSAREKLANELKLINEITSYLQSNEGRAVVEGYKTLLSAYNQILNNAFNLNVKEMTNYFISVMEAEDHILQVRNNFVKVLEKNATKLY